MDSEASTMMNNATRLVVTAGLFVSALTLVSGAAKTGLGSQDLYKLQSVGDVQASPDGDPRRLQRPEQRSAGSPVFTAVDDVADDTQVVADRR